MNIHWQDMSTTHTFSVSGLIILKQIVIFTSVCLKMLRYRNMILLCNPVSQLMYSIFFKIRSKIYMAQWIYQVMLYLKNVSYENYIQAHVFNLLNYLWKWAFSETCLQKLCAFNIRVKASLNALINEFNEEVQRYRRCGRSQENLDLVPASIIQVMVILIGRWDHRDITAFEYVL